ncbi:MAG: hypothetical protein LBS23_03005, partial [Holosporaceae bacterium]|nr:hypothetical protein [Holosporaceae bacterium]
ISIGEDKILKKKKSITSIIRLLAANGLSEVVTYSFTKHDYAVEFKEDKNLIRLINPISADLDVMRPSLIPNLLLTAKRSLNYGQSAVRICESGNVFYNTCQQDLHISGLRTGSVDERNWRSKSRIVDVFDAKSDIISLLEYFGIHEKDITIESSIPSYYHQTRGGAILYGRKKLGFFGELHPKIKKFFDISENVVCFEIFADVLLENRKKNQPYTLKVYPKISRDFSFVFSSKTAVGQVVNAIYKLDHRISKVDIFDRFAINSLQNSIGIAVVLDAIDRTLTESEAQEVSEKIIQYVKSAGGELRGK